MVAVSQFEFGLVPGQSCVNVVVVDADDGHIDSGEGVYVVYCWRISVNIALSS